MYILTHIIFTFKKLYLLAYRLKQNIIVLQRTFQPRKKYYLKYHSQMIKKTITLSFFMKKPLFETDDFNISSLL